MIRLKTLSKKLGSESGALLMASTMGIFILLSLFAFYLSRLVIQESRNASFHALDIKARNLALTGIEHAMQSYKMSRNISNITGNFNNGSYSVSFDTQNNETGAPLPYSQYITVKSTATINDVERNLRLIISPMPEAFCFSFYGDNSDSETFTEPNGTINGDMFYNGNIESNSGTNSGVTYTSTGTGGTLLSSPPSFPTLDITEYEALLTSAASAPSTYNNYALGFDGSNDYVRINNSSDINTGSNNHTQKTIEAWFKVENKNITSRKQTIYEQGGTIRGLNIYVYDGHLYVGGWNEPNGESAWAPGTWLSTSNIQSNTWHHVALTLNGGNSVTNNAFKGYLDGTQFGSGQGSKLWNHSGDVSIGRNKDTKFHSGDYNTAKYFAGMIDEVRLWNVERTASQIAVKKDTVLAGNESGLTAYYNFQENTGSIANDTQTQSNNDGTINNGAFWTDGPPLPKMGSSTFTNTTINLSSYSNSQLLTNSNLNISGSIVNGPGFIVVNGNLSISSNTTINGNIFLICNGNLTISDCSEIGTELGSAVVIYSKGVADFNNSTIYGLIISKGNSLELDGSKVYGTILNYGSSFSLVGDSDITGSVISKYSVDFQGNSASITKGNMPTFLGLNIGLDPMVVPGSYLEY
ncbi:MAG: LamG domain-containing protein [Candidatus Marinimicrobia bacterium]|jgi:hypothetical protein|nr:LamG domain-containing protein [Candidatus Neomarinimicrobiota bacterium]MBT3936675.1 LamG domain-containing protein [Candidatus Neomarinimicrobiota bacterium]MBT3960521.1 LamG domain-containing protein [Candidatus Neomarinimicrobiota bacterium]MBT4382152.1 LamG domain-containing protein [Candidatus Neomarinimicrobiota bacterium]MBT4635989.1 LamG domain-containing protein [Candidatus Neomarinimicrobiota bacterium]